MKTKQERIEELENGGMTIFDMAERIYELEQEVKLCREAIARWDKLHGMYVRGELGDYRPKP